MVVLGCAHIAQSSSLQTQGRGRKPEKSWNAYDCASLLREMMFIHRVIYLISSHWGPQTIIIQMERRCKDLHGTHVCSLYQIAVLFLTALLSQSVVFYTGETSVFFTWIEVSNLRLLFENSFCRRSILLLANRAFSLKQRPECGLSEGRHL